MSIGSLPSASVGLPLNAPVIEPVSLPSGLIYGFVLSGPTAGRSILWHELEQRQLRVAPTVSDDPVDDLDREAIWLHMDYSDTRVQQWLQSQENFTGVVTEALLREETRPRTSIVHAGLLMSLRSINFGVDASPEEMVAIRVWTDSRIILSTRKRHILSIDHLADSVTSGLGPSSVSQFIAQLIEGLIDNMQETITDVEEAVDTFEEQSISRTGQSLRMEVADIRRQAIALRRYLAPQREALAALVTSSFSWLTVDDRLRLRESNDHLHRYVEDLDAVRDRAAVVQEELASRVAEQVNERMFMLSVVAAIFLPLGFVTGLLGVNLGGIPGANSAHAFWVLIGAMSVLVAIQLMVFKAKQWF